MTGTFGNVNPPSVPMGPPPERGQEGSAFGAAVAAGTQIAIGAGTGYLEGQIRGGSTSGLTAALSAVGAGGVRVVGGAVGAGVGLAAGSAWSGNPPTTADLLQTTAIAAGTIIFGPWGGVAVAVAIELHRAGVFDPNLDDPDGGHNGASLERRGYGSANVPSADMDPLGYGPALGNDVRIGHEYNALDQIANKGFYAAVGGAHYGINPYSQSHYSPTNPSGDNDPVNDNDWRLHRNDWRHSENQGGPSNCICQAAAAVHF